METRVAVYSTNELLFAVNKGVQPALQKSNVVYQFACHCDISRYVGLLPQRLQDRIKQHISKSICSFSSSRNAYFLPFDANLPPRLIPNLLLLIEYWTSSFLQNSVCAQHYYGSRFFILAQGCSFFYLSAPLSTFAQNRFSFHLSAFLSIYVLSSKLSNPPSADKKNSFTT